ncbi:MAG: hypothetical protein ACREMY_12735, partial [bacterium]
MAANDIEGGIAEGINMDISKNFLSRLACLCCATVITVVPQLSVAEPGDITDNSGKIPFDQAFFAFEVEGPVSTLKEVPI